MTDDDTTTHRAGTGVWFVGARGSVATTAVVGALGVSHGLAPATGLVTELSELGPDGLPGRAAVCQIDGRRWITLEGLASVSRVPAEVADAERRYAVRYRTPRVNPRRVVLTITVDRLLGHT